MTRASLAARLSIAICIAVVVTVANAQTPTAPTSTAPIDDALRGAIAHGDVPGVVALVTDRKGVLYRGAFGIADVESKRQMTVDSMFRIASMTKAVTSVALMQLVEQGKLGVDDPADKYLPELSKLPVFQSFDAATDD